MRLSRIGGLVALASHIVVITLFSAGLALPQGADGVPEAGDKVMQSGRETFGGAIDRLISDPDIVVEWLDQSVADMALPVEPAADRSDALRSVLSQLDYVAVYSAETPERRLKRLVIVGLGTGNPSTGAAIAASITGGAGGLKDFAPEQVDATAVEISEYVARISSTIGWQANSHLAHMNQMQRTAVADGSYEAGFRFANESAGFPPLYRPRPVGDPERDAAIAQALTTRMAIRGLHALSQGLDKARQQ
jgi:hypothetical protein